MLVDGISFLVYFSSILTIYYYFFKINIKNETSLLTWNEGDYYFHNKSNRNSMNYVFTDSIAKVGWEIATKKIREKKQIHGI